MSRRFPQFVAAAAAILVLAVTASPALASGPPPAYNVYVEQVPTAKGPKSVPAKLKTTPAQSVPLPAPAAVTLQRQGGKDRQILKTVATSPAYGVHARVIEDSASAPLEQTPPSAYDLGWGPTALFAALLAAACVLALGGGLRRRRTI